MRTVLLGASGDSRVKERYTTKKKYFKANHIAKIKKLPLHAKQLNTSNNRSMQWLWLIKFLTLNWGWRLAVCRVPCTSSFVITLLLSKKRRLNQSLQCAWDFPVSATNLEFLASSFFNSEEFSYLFGVSCTCRKMTKSYISKHWLKFYSALK